jgi:hypothetical protein
VWIASAIAVCVTRKLGWLPPSGMSAKNVATSKQHKHRNHLNPSLIVWHLTHFIILIVQLYGSARHCTDTGFSRCRIQSERGLRLRFVYLDTSSHVCRPISIVCTLPRSWKARCFLTVWLVSIEWTFWMNAQTSTAHAPWGTRDPNAIVSVPQGWRYQLTVHTNTFYVALCGTSYYCYIHQDTLKC